MAYLQDELFGNKITFHLVQDACSCESNATMCLLKITVCGTELSDQEA